MVLNLKEYNENIPVNPDVKIKKVRDLESLKIWLDIVIKMFSFDKSFSGDYLRIFQELCLGDSSPFVFYLVEHENQIAATGALYKGQESAGLYWISSLPEKRGLGIATAILNQMLSDSKSQGYATTVLQSSKMGVQLYKNFGFKIFGDVKTYYFSGDKND
jgi:GNAT superfamily N-acetyltransferase